MTRRFGIVWMTGRPCRAAGSGSMTPQRSSEVDESASTRQPVLAKSRRRRVVVALCAFLVLCGVAVFLTVRSGSDESSIALLPDDSAVLTRWPGSTVLNRGSDDVSRMYERESMILSVLLADGSKIIVTASDYSGPVRAWFAAKAFSPSWNGYYWDYPQRHPAQKFGSDLPPDSRLVGFECPDDSGESLECKRWILWWKRGRGIWVVDWGPQKWATTAEAVAVMSPLWR